MKDYSQEVRSLIEHENHLVNYRLTWLITLQGLLFAGLGFAWDKPTALRLVVVFVAMGITSAVSCLYSLFLTQMAIRRQEVWWTQHRPESYEGPDVIGLPVRWPALIALPWCVLPTAFAVGWIAILLFTLCPAEKPVNQACEPLRREPDWHVACLARTIE